MNKMQRVTAIAMLALSSFGIWSSATHSQNQGQPIAKDGGARSPSPAQTGMSPEEKLVRDVYARLMRYQSAAVGELSTTNKKAAKPEDYLTFELRAIHTGAIGEIYNKPVIELMTPRGSEVLSITPNHLSKNKSNDPPHASYMAEWSTSVKRKESADSFGNEKEPGTIGDDPTRPGTARTVAEMLERGGERFANVTSYTSYDVTARLNGKQRTYRALVLYRAGNGKLGAYQTEEERSARLASVEILDNVTSEMTTVLKDESPYARSPWNKYSKSTLYLAVARTIKETREAGTPLIPANAPIGYLPGDDVTPNKSDMQSIAADCSTVQVFFSSITAVGKGFTNTVQVTINPANTSITLSLTTLSGTGLARFTANDSTTVTITQSTTLEIRGVAESSTAANIALEARRDVSDPVVLTSERFTVLLVTLALKSSSGDSVSSDNAAQANYSSAIGTTSLGTRFSTGTAAQMWRTNVEIVATVIPANFSFPVVLTREVIGARLYNDQINIGSEGTHGDASDPAFRDDDPQSGGSGGKVYDLDAPGVSLSSPSNPNDSILRARTNYRQWATVDGGVRVSDDLQWFSRLSIRKTVIGDVLQSDIPGDNMAGSGLTNVSWNLQ